MKGIRIRWKAVIPAVGILVGVLTDPEAVGAIAGALPDKAAHWVLALSALAAVFAPAVATNRPPSIKSDGSGQPLPPFDPTVERTAEVPAPLPHDSDELPPPDEKYGRWFRDPDAKG